MLVLPIPAPLVREGCAAREPHFAVDHEDATMRAPIRPVHPPRRDRVVIGELAAGVRHHPHIGIIERPAGTNAVEQHADMHAGASAFGQRIAKLPTNAV